MGHRPPTCWRDSSAGSSNLGFIESQRESAGIQHGTGLEGTELTEEAKIVPDGGVLDDGVICDPVKVDVADSETSASRADRTVGDANFTLVCARPGEEQCHPVVLRDHFVHGRPRIGGNVQHVPDYYFELLAPSRPRAPVTRFNTSTAMKRSTALTEWPLNTASLNASTRS